MSIQKKNKKKEKQEGSGPTPAGLEFHMSMMLELDKMVTAHMILKPEMEENFRQFAPIWVATEALKLADSLATPGTVAKSNIGFILGALDQFKMEDRFLGLYDGADETNEREANTPVHKLFDGIKANHKEAYDKLRKKVMKECKEQLLK